MMREACNDGRHIHCYQNPMHLYNIEYMLQNDGKMSELWEKAAALAETELQCEHLERSRLGYTYTSLLYTFDERMEKADEEERQALIAKNKAFYEALKANSIEPRGWQSKLPELTDFTQNMGKKIYW